MTTRDFFVLIVGCITLYYGVSRFRPEVTVDERQFQATPYPTLKGLRSTALDVEQQEQCTVVFIHNRKGCVFGPKAPVEKLIQGSIRSDSTLVEEDAWWTTKDSSPLRGATPDASIVGSYGPQSTIWKDTEIVATEALDLQPLLDSRPTGYGGADVAASFKAPRFNADGGKPHRIWLLGDTFLGRLQGHRRLPGFFVHNSVALVPQWSKPAQELDPSQVKFWHNTSEEGCPSSLFRLEREGDNECHEDGEYLWPISGMAVDLEGGGSKLIILASRWTYIPWIEEDVDLSRSIFNFNILGTTLIVVDNAQEIPPKWEYRTRNLEGTGPWSNWVSAVVPADPTKEVATQEDELIYLLGTSGKAALHESSQILGRVQVKRLLDLSLQDMEVWSLPPDLPDDVSAIKQQQQQEGIQEDSSAVLMKPAWAPLSLLTNGDLQPVSLTSPVYTGTSLHYHPHLQVWYSIAIDWIGKRALLQTAEEITGPWDSTPVYDIPAPFNGSTLMAYTGKAHPELITAENEIVFTFVANSPGVVYPLFDEGADILYVPRFIRLTFNRKRKHVK